MHFPPTCALMPIMNLIKHNEKGQCVLQLCQLGRAPKSRSSDSRGSMGKPRMEK